jgi:hypothetical protein
MSSEPARSPWSVVSYAVSAVVVAASCVFPLAALVGGPVSTLVGYLAYRRTRRVLPLLVGAFPLAAGVLWFGVALVVSGPAVFTGTAN